MRPDIACWPEWNDRRKSWVINYFNPGSQQLQTVYDEDGVMMEFKFKQEAQEYIDAKLH